ncbi:ROK family protein [Candidatus Woesearchaeota archaeon]|nr:ROK family protein [Candidatus Woesearchaeota archaeon]
MQGIMREYILTADIGATNTRIALYSTEIKLIELIEIKTDEIKNKESFVRIIKQKLKKIFSRLQATCIACAGPVNHKLNQVQLTNSHLLINSKHLNEQFKKENISCKDIYLLNDFEALGYGINKILNSSKSSQYSTKELTTIKKGKPVRLKTIALLGAGTGLGKSIAVYNKDKNIYQPFPSEGGHADFPIQNYYELQLAEFIRKQTNYTNLCYEDILSGKGIVHIYDFLYLKYEYNLKKEQLALKKKIDKADDKAALISKNRKTDFLCKETFRLFAKYYAICLRNLALETMPLSGIYIGGGIAAKNADIFNYLFIQEFEKHDVYRHLLKNIPIYLITDKTLSLYGCALYARQKSTSLIY